MSKFCLKKYKAIIVVLLLGIVFFVMNTSIPFFSDDIWLARNIGPQDDCIGMCNYLLDFAWNFWNNENGRIVNQLLWKILCISGEHVFDVFNMVLLLLTVFFVTCLVVPEKLRLHSLPYAIIFLYELYLVPHSESLYYWAAGSLNYLFPSVLAAGYLLMLKWLDEKKNVHALLLYVIGAYSFMAGFTHEIYTLPISFSIFVFLAFKKFKVNHLLYVPIFCYWLGAALVVLSPGTIHRIMGHQGGMGDVSFLSVLISKILQSFKIFHYGRMFYVVLFALIYAIVFKRSSFLANVKKYTFLLLCMFSSLAIVSILGVGGRAVCGIEFFALLIILKYISSLPLIEHKYVTPSFAVLVLILVHQAFLVSYVEESWNTYKQLEAKIDVRNHKVLTLEMEDWKSDNLLVDPFVAHPYKMMREDIWMRKPLYCEVCRKDVYQTLLEGNGSYGIVGDDFILAYTDSIKNEIKKGNLYMKLEPVNSDLEGGALFRIWHIFVQSVMPSRYPTDVQINENNVTVLHVGDMSFLRFESPYAPIPRKINSVYQK